MLIELLLLVVGLTILLAGGEALVRGASSLARNVGVSPLAIGLTVVAFGTSAPELAVNVGAALGDTGALAFGNVFGSNMANIGLIVGLVAVLAPIPIHNNVIRRELPMLLLATAAAGVLAFDVDLGGGRHVYERGDGLILLLFFVVFLYYTVGDLLRRRGSGRADPGALFELPDDEEPPSGHPWRDVGLSLLGLAGLIWGADITVNAAVEVARDLGVPEVVIGLTLVSLGTSLPELVAALTAVYHRSTDMAIGSIIGSNIFNTLLVAGVTATISPMPIPPSGRLDIAATALLTLTLTLTSSTHRQIIIRYEGLLLLAIYSSYILYRTVTIASGGS